MTDQERKAMEMALEALENCAVSIDSEWGDCRSIEEMRETGEYTRATTKAIEALRQALAQPEQEPTVPDNMQDWANLDGDIAWHLIDRHADNWADIKKMMDEFVAAKIASAQSKHECETCVNKRKRPEQSGFLKSPLRGEE